MSSELVRAMMKTERVKNSLVALESTLQAQLLTPQEQIVCIALMVAKQTSIFAAKDQLSFIDAFGEMVELGMDE